MARKTKTQELIELLRSTSAFLIEVDFITYRVPVCVLAGNAQEAEERARELYPACEVKVCGQLVLVH